MYDAVEVHHAIKLADDAKLAFDSNNLITLCREHHKQADDGIISLEEIKKIIAEQENKKI